MSTPQDPFAAPDPSRGADGPPSAQPLPTAPPLPPASSGAPGSYGSAYGAATPYGQPTTSGWQGPPLAPWGTRVGGYLIDTLISIVIQVVLTLISRPLGQLASIAVFLYFGYLTGTTGQTPGRKAMGIRVLREADGQPLGAGAGIGRAFLHILDALPFLLGFLWPIWDAKKQTFADKIIHSVVVRT